ELLAHLLLAHPAGDLDTDRAQHLFVARLAAADPDEVHRLACIVKARRQLGELRRPLLLARAPDGDDARLRVGPALQLKIGLVDRVLQHRGLAPREPLELECLALAAAHRMAGAEARHALEKARHGTHQRTLAIQARQTVRRVENRWHRRWRRAERE